jgi:hypothetical protein
LYIDGVTLQDEKAERTLAHRKLAAQIMTQVDRMEDAGSQTKAIV